MIKLSQILSEIKLINLNNITPEMVIELYRIKFVKGINDFNNRKIEDFKQVIRNKYNRGEGFNFFNYLDNPIQNISKQELKKAYSEISQFNSNLEEIKLSGSSRQNIKALFAQILTILGPGKHGNYNKRKELSELLSDKYDRLPKELFDEFLNRLNQQQLISLFKDLMDFRNGLEDNLDEIKIIKFGKFKVIKSDHKSYVPNKKRVYMNEPKISNFGGYILNNENEVIFPGVMPFKYIENILINRGIKYKIDKDDLIIPLKYIEFTY